MSESEWSQLITTACTLGGVVVGHLFVQAAMSLSPKHCLKIIAGAAVAVSLLLAVVTFLVFSGGAK